MITDLKWLLDYAADASKHFLLSGAMGFLGLSLTWITLSALRWGVARLTRRQTSTAVGYGIAVISLLVGLSLCLLSHYALDYYSTWYTTPLGPPLQIDTGGVDF